MKNTLLAFATALICAGTATAQKMDAYDMQVSQGTYQEITDGTVVSVEDEGEYFAGLVIDGSGEAHYSEPFTGNGFPIGFDFNFNGKEMNQFMIATDGYVLIGKDQVSSTTPYNSFFVFSNGEDHDLFGFTGISGVWGIPETQISYKMEGEAPNRSLVVQYKNLVLLDRSFSNTPADTIQAQLRMHENGNLSMTFNGFEPCADANMESVSLKMGILGDVNDRQMRIDYTSTSTTTEDKMIGWTHEKYPADGVTYTFVVPEPCQTPTTQPTNVNLNATTTGATAQFEKGTDTDHTLFVITKETALSEMPANGTYYKEGSVIGNAQVIAATSSTSFTTSKYFTRLDPSTTYNVFAFGYNAKCLDGPLYNTNNPYSTTMKTMAGAPKSLAICGADATTINFNVETAEGVQAIVVVTDSIKTTPQGNVFNEGVSGTPNGIMNVGDVMAEGGRVVYIGETAKNIAISDLKPGKIHYIKAWSTDGNGNYSSEFRSVNTYTAGSLPWSGNIDNMPTFEAPIGWQCQGSANVSMEGTITIEALNVNENEGTEIWAETPYMYLTDNLNRITSTVTLESYGNNRGYTFGDNDKFAIQVAKESGEWVDLMSYNKDNDPAFGNAANLRKIIATFDNFTGEKVHFRYYAKVHKDACLSIGSVDVTEKPACDFPINVTADISQDAEAVITWQPQGEEDAWEVTYKSASSEEWQDTVLVREPSYTFEDMEAMKAFDVKVRAMCSSEMYSEWSDVCSFTTKLYVPFNMVIAEQATEPEGWKSYSGALADPTVLEENIDFLFSNHYGSTALYFSHYGETCNSWYVTPTIDLGTGKEYTFNLDITTGYWSSYSTNATDNRIVLMVAKDGENFYSADSLMVISHDQYKEENTEYQFSETIKGLDGKVKLGIYVEATNGQPLAFYINAIGMKEMVPDNINGINGADGSKAIEGIYTIDGRKMNGLGKGINIIRFSDGETKKVVIK